ncbi:MAG: asparaginase [Bacteroidota bacterium]
MGKKSKAIEYKIAVTRTSEKDATGSILLIYTGGTIGMIKDESGSLVPFNFNAALQKVPELSQMHLKMTMVSFPVLLDSSSIRIEDWQSLGTIIHENYDQYDGFVILHGTDTMAYTASALSYMLEGLRKPVVLTGAQIPIGELRSDARENLVAALQIASAKEAGVPIVQEVTIYFNFVLLRGNRSQKVRSSTFGAFESANYPELAKSGIFIEYNKPNLLKTKKSDTLTLRAKFEPNVLILKVFPGLNEQALRCILGMEGLKGIVLETFGSGNTMTYDWFIDALKETIDRGVVVYNVSQCSGGEVIPGRYAASKRLMDIGVVSGGDITSEAAITKLMFLLANGRNAVDIKRKLELPLRGEMDT